MIISFANDYHSQQKQKSGNEEADVKHLITMNTKKNHICGNYMKRGLIL